MVRVLIVDDHAVVREGLRLLLDAQQDITVVGEAVDGRDAIGAAIDLRPDVVLMDLVMPALNGIEATRQICEQLRTTKIIVLSGYATKEHVYQAVRAGASGYLLKDAAGVELINAIRTVHLGRSYLSQRILEAGYIDEGELQRFAQARRGPLESLSRREKEILQLVVEGRSSASIADMLGLSVKTVETYRSRLMHKLGVFDVASLVKFAIQHGVTSVE